VGFPKDGCVSQRVQVRKERDSAALRPDALIAEIFSEADDDGSPEGQLSRGGDPVPFLLAESVCRDLGVNLWREAGGQR
jgi:hypothetical protein